MKDIMQGQKIIAMKTGAYSVTIETEKEKLIITPHNDSPLDTLIVTRRKKAEPTAEVKGK